MGKVSFDIGIDSVTGILIGSDPFYIRRYKRKDGRIEYIVQARPDRSGHKATPAARRPCRPTCGKSAVTSTMRSTTGKPIGNC